MPGTANRVPTSLGYTVNLRAIQDGEMKLSEVQAQIASGKKIKTAMDDPVGISRILTLQQEQLITEQYQQSIVTTKNVLSFEEDQVADVLDQIQAAHDLVIQAISARSTADYHAIATQLVEIREHLISVANRKVDGQYIFSGAATNSLAVIKDPVTGAYVYNGDDLQRDAQIGSTLTVATSDTAKNVFFGFATKDASIAGYTGQAGVTSTNAGLVNSGTLTAVTANRLQINGTTIAPAITDGVSTTDAAASAIATANAINASTPLHGVIATVNSNTFNFAGGTYTTNALAAGDLTINGVQIVGNPGASPATLAALINTTGGTGIPGVVAGTYTDGLGAVQLQLVAADGRNIELVTGGAAVAMNFTNFATTGGGPLDEVMRGTFTLNNYQPFTVTGSITGVGVGTIGITAGTVNVAPNGGNTGSGVLSPPTVFTTRPPGSTNEDEYLIKFSSPTQFNIYKRSAPNTPLKQFQTFAAGQTYINATNAITVPNTPATYTPGNTYIVEGVQFTLTGAPAQGDTFTVALNQVESQDLFNSLQSAIDALNSGNPSNAQSLNYKLGLTLSNLDSAEQQAVGIRCQIGARLELAETQEYSNKAFILLSEKNISVLEDLDYARAINKLLLEKMALESIMEVAPLLLRLSLFNSM